MSNTGLPANGTMLFDAVIYKGENANIVIDSKYQNSNAVQGNTPGMVLLDTGVLPVSALGGIQCINILWDSTSTVEKDIRVRIQENGGDFIDIYASKPIPAQKFGTPVIFMFNPKSEYRVVVDQLSANTVNLDYIQFTPVTPGTVFYHTQIVDTTYLNDYIRMDDCGTATITGTGAATADVKINFNVIFTDPPVLELTPHNHLFTPSIVSKSEDSCVIRIVDVNLAKFSTAVNIDWVAKGNVQISKGFTISVGV